ncbi:hypothetical protein GSQ42_17675, partial [Clostridioides difficile]|nr:hypothetical protein [Clostridioides difficile]
SYIRSSQASRGRCAWPKRGCWWWPDMSTVNRNGDWNNNSRCGLERGSVG